MIPRATHGRSGRQRAVYGSVAEQVLRRSTRPVLLVRVLGSPVEPPDLRRSASRRATCRLSRCERYFIFFRRSFFRSASEKTNYQTKEKYRCD